MIQEVNVQFQKIFTPSTEGIGISCGKEKGGFCETKNVKKSMNLNWNL